MTKTELRNNILNFSQNNLLDNSLNLFSTLGYKTKRQVQVSSVDDFKNRFLKNTLNEEKALYSDWKDVQFLFELQPNDLNSDETEITGGKSGDKIIEAYWFIAIELNGNTYTKKQLSDITREINKQIAVPVFIIFKYTDKLTFSIIDRRLNKKDDNKDVLEKVVLIKDINFNDPHRAHIEILNDISFENLNISNFVDLHLNWLKALSVSELNKRFYTELSNWFFWTMDTCQLSKENSHKDNIMFGIRMVTRIIFDWFIKEKGLLSENIFDKQTYLDLLKPEYREQGDLYYKVVLQNLFFGCLSKPMDRREFRSEDRFQGKNAGYDVNNLFRYRKYLNNPQDIIDLFKDIPFLNGGLFECTDEKRNGRYIDCFTDCDSKNFLKIPDDIFFMEDEKVVDLSEHFDGNRSYKNAKVKGLFTILNSYKFTIDETTPVEEEIALDPELLGRVFENLLAAHNPETKTTARKSTGSYYTPREIVDYMCEQSLINYLKTKVERLNIENIDNKLTELLSYSETHSFNDNEVNELIKAVNEVKILDPACGSGAFPMGLLHKLVHVLSKLDPHNEKWKESQIDKASQIDDIEAREEAIKIIEKQFNDNEMDYSRKLYLIQNCIFGVDIQPMATQISRLRFFISLIVEERPNVNKLNMGILALPNLETKFVAANTLIDLNENNLFAQAPKIIELKKKLEKIREGYFRANTSQRKESLKTQDEKIREQIKQEAVILNLDLGQAAKLAQWSPYDKDYSSAWFNPKWMFNVEKFDIVIGNPPYIQLQKFKGNPLQKLYKEVGFEVYDSSGDIYCLFYEKGIKLLKQNGYLCYITSNKWMSSGYGERLRDYFINYSNPKQLIDFGGFKVFESATVDVNIILVENSKYTNKTLSCRMDNSFEELNKLRKYILNNSAYQAFCKDSWCILNPIEQAIKEKVKKFGIPFKEWNISINRGILTGLNDAFIIDENKKNELISLDSRNEEIIKPLLRGRDIQRYMYNFENRWLINTHNGTKDIKAINIDNYPVVKQFLNQYYDKLKNRDDQGHTPYNLRNCAYIQDFNYKKIVWAETIKIYFNDTRNYPRFALVDENYHLDKTAFFIKANGYEYFLGILNSKLFEYLLDNGYSNKLGSGSRGLQKNLIENLPIIEVNNDIKNKIEQKIKFIIGNRKSKDFDKNKELQQKVNEYETQIDIMVYKIYDLTFDEVKTVDPNFSMSEQDYNNYKL